MREDMDPAPELSEVPIERLEGVPMCLLRSDDLWSYNDFLVQECQRSGFTPNVTCHCYDTPMAMQMVLSGFGISFLPQLHSQHAPGRTVEGKACARPSHSFLCRFGVEQRCFERPVRTAVCRRDDLKKLSAR